ncbi:hypothetical protein Bcop_2417 [Bacteroides coprosuis DSM 18011]|uniref:Uncharacterized protein n=1 Tax=Bacteroides coprosuis DSM 18011 TaxID=679937 RepID=F3ZNZ6_9BACE|nr:hypothetical protein Bcop_2417 [Bacteroides coprosuis DSM 18011]
MYFPDIFIRSVKSLQAVLRYSVFFDTDMRMTCRCQSNVLSVLRSYFDLFKVFSNLLLDSMLYRKMHRK